MGMTEQTNRAHEFDSFAANYQELHNASIRLSGESSEYFAAYKAKFIARNIAIRPTRKILDYGCGVGLVCSQLKRHLPGARVDGFDVSKVSLDQINPALREQGVFTSNVSDLEHDYDTVVMANVLHHIEPAARQAAVSEAVGLLNRGGNLVVFEHNPAHPLTRRVIKQCAFDENAILLPPRESRGYLAAGGLVGIRRHYIVFFPRALKWFRPMEEILRWCPAGAQYALIGRRS
jgi:2-polyprenyl-3-methyl-5-hydroxy-6-metoxy-1,4-benzoquinol methylase